MPLRPLLKFAFLLVAVLACCAFWSCSNEKNDDETQGNTAATLVVLTTKKQEKTTAAAQKDSADDKTYVILDDSNTIISGGGATFENNILTISEGGTYSLMGTLSDGKIYINSADEDKKVKIIFDGVSIFCSSDAPFYVENSPDETVIILADGTENFLSDSGREVPTDPNAEYATAAVYSKDDLQIEGSGALYVTGTFNKGIFSKNDVDIRGGNITVTSTDDGIRGKDSVDISGGKISIKAGGDGIRTSETVQNDKGDINISGGIISVISSLDGIQATCDVNISGGDISVISGGGATGDFSSSEQGVKEPDGFFGPPPYGRPPADSSQFESEQEVTASKKGIKAQGNIAVTAGRINVSSADDSIHAESISISDGEFILETDDDAIHADESAVFFGGDINIKNSFEGVEAKKIEIDDADIIIKAQDDGFNAVDSLSSGEMLPPDAVDDSCEIIIKDGYVHIDADGDGIDSNGSVDMSGGTLVVFGPEREGNSALDYAGIFNISDGTLLAVGSAGMAQSVSADDDVGVVAFRYQQSTDTLLAITDDEDDLCVALKNVKSYSTVVYASDDIDSGEKYNIYYGGSVRGEYINGVYFEGEYSKGTLVGAVSS